MTVAESCCVVPIEVKLKLVGDTVTEVATGVGGVGGGVGGVVGELLSSPHAVSSSKAAKACTLNLRVSFNFLDAIADKCIATLSLLYRRLNEFLM